MNGKMDVIRELLDRLQSMGRVEGEVRELRLQLLDQTKAKEEAQDLLREKTMQIKKREEADEKLYMFLVDLASELSMSNVALSPTMAERMKHWQSETAGIPF